MTGQQERLGKKLFEMMAVAGQSLGWADLLMLKSAWQGKLRWEEMPDKLREAFGDLAADIGQEYNPR